MPSPGLPAFPLPNDGIPLQGELPDTAAGELVELQRHLPLRPPLPFQLLLGGLVQLVLEGEAVVWLEGVRLQCFF